MMLDWLSHALLELGTREVPGPGDNPRIAEYHRATTLPERYAAEDETPWCSSFVNWCFLRAGLPRTRSARARSWSEWGTFSPERLGAVVVLSRGSQPAAGHVGFWVGRTGQRIHLLGGNQGDAVSIAAFRETRIVAVRWPKEEMGPRVDVASVAKRLRDLAEELTA